ncbi:MAG TPA: glycosyltransferase family 39 protein [Gemmatimonadaceae bacterium]
MSTTAVPRSAAAPRPEFVVQESAAPASLSRTLLILSAVVAVSGLYTYWHLGRGWIPFDDGALAHSAERVLQGELPHRDFDDVYTGGLALLNAAAFKLFGTTLMALRLMVLAAFVVWLPSVYYIAARFLRPLAAAGVTALAAVWSLPNYPAGMPSWYNLFFATFGVAALFRYLEDRRLRWLAVAGVAGGLSFLMKVVGLYYVAGVLLFLVFHVHEESRATRGGTSSGIVYPAFVSACLLAFVLAIGALVGKQLHATNVMHFLVPPAFLAALLAQNEWKEPAGTSRERFVDLLRVVGVFLGGVAIPVALFLVPYALSGSVGAFVYGVFVLPTKRFSFAVFHPPSLSTLAALIPLALLLYYARRLESRTPRWILAGLVLALAAVCVETAYSPPLYRTVWYALRNLIPVLTVLGVTVLSQRREAEKRSPLLRERVFLLLSVTAVCSLVQFPFAVPNYFLYVAPLALLTVIALSFYFRPMAPGIPAVVLGFFLVFGVTRNNSVPLSALAFFYWPYTTMKPLTMERGAGITVIDDEAADWNAVVPLLKEHARGGYTWASSDCPELYFLSGLRNPTRSLFEFFDEPKGRVDRVFRALDTHGVTVIVLNRRPAFSPTLTVRLLDGLYERYPHGQDAGRFHVRWR